MKELIYNHKIKGGISVLYKKKDDTVDFIIRDIHTLADCFEVEGKSIDLDGKKEEFSISSEKESFLLPELLARLIKIEGNHVLVRYSYNEKLYDIFKI